MERGGETESGRVLDFVVDEASGGERCTMTLGGEPVAVLTADEMAEYIASLKRLHSELIGATS